MKTQFAMAAAALALVAPASAAAPPAKQISALKAKVASLKHQLVDAQATIARQAVDVNKAQADRDKAQADAISYVASLAPPVSIKTVLPLIRDSWKSANLSGFSPTYSENGRARIFEFTCYSCG